MACSKTEGKPDSAAASEPAVPAAIDTTVPTILGIAANRTPGAAGWCMLSAHRDVWVGRPIKIVWTSQRKIIETKVGDTIPACPGPEATPGAKAYDLTFGQQIPPLDGTPAIVLRNDVWGNVGRNLVADFDLDGDQLKDTITTCTNGSVARFRMVYAGATPRRPWTHEMPYTSLDEPLCADANVPPPDPNAPSFHPSAALLPPTYQPPYGSEWMALRTINEQQSIVKTPVLPMSAGTTCSNGQEGKRLVATAALQGYEFLFFNLPLKEGPVEKAERDYHGTATSSDSVIMTMRGKRVTMRREPFGVNGFRVTAEVGASVFPLFETPTSEYGKSQIYWAGDLDGDRDIDFILNAHAKNWQRGLQLYLSSQRTFLSWPVAATYTERPC